ncbi:MAG: thermonuclease family protein [Planctomycetota bacterium]
MRQISLIFFFLLVTGCGNIYVVEEVIAVDQIRVEGGEIFRYIGVKAPAKENYYYEKSMELHRKLLSQKKIRVEKDAGIPNGYYVFVKDLENPAKDTLVNAELLLFGRAWLNEDDMNLYSKSQKQNYLDQIEHAQKVAKENKEGVWEREP